MKKNTLRKKIIIINDDDYDIHIIIIITSSSGKHREKRDITFLFFVCQIELQSVRKR